MLILLPFLTLLLICFALRLSLKNLDLRPVMLLGALVWGVILTAITEILSWLNIFKTTFIAAVWGMALGVVIVWVIWKLRTSDSLRGKFGRPDLFNPLQSFQYLIIAAIILITGIIAVIAAPNNWDSMVYHLSRAMHWLQNGSVAFYPTHIIRQLYLPPWSEYLLAHMLALSGGDTLVQLTQWLAMLGSVMGVTWIAKQLGAGKGGQIFAAFITATLPMGILQSITTQNDYVATFWLVCLAAFIFQAAAQMKNGHHKNLWTWNLSIAASLGLALLTKSTAYIFAFPFMLYYGLVGLKHHRLRFIKVVLLITVIVLSLNLPHYYRNYSLFGYPLGPQDEVASYRNDPISLKGTLSNILRNTGLYLGSVKPVNQFVNQAISEVHNWIGLDVNDPRFTWSDHSFSVETPRAHEDTTGSNLHLLLAAGGLLLLSVKRKYLPSKDFLLYAGLILAGYLFFCIYLRWQTWHPRLHLPLLVLSGAWGGLLSKVLHKRLVWGISILLALFILPVFYFNPNKPLIADYTIFNLPRREVMIMRKSLVVPYIEGVNYLTVNENCFQVGLFIPDEEWEYPLWRLYEETGNRYRLEHVNVDNPSGKLATAPFEPCAVFSTQTLGDTLMVRDRTYTTGWSMKPVRIYVAE